MCSFKLLTVTFYHTQILMHPDSLLRFWHYKNHWIACSITSKTMQQHINLTKVQNAAMKTLTKELERCDEEESGTDGLSAVDRSEQLCCLNRARTTSAEYSLQPARNTDSAWTCDTITTACVNSDSDHIAPSVWRSFCNHNKEQLVMTYSWQSCICKYLKIIHIKCCISGWNTNSNTTVDLHFPPSYST